MIDTIMIDAGHGGTDSGARYAFAEKDFNLLMAKLIAYTCESKGIDTLMTRREDVALTLRQRVSMYNVSSANLLISIHANACEDIQANGLEIYTTDDYIDIANIFSESLSLTPQIRMRGVKDGSNLYILKHSLKPAILIEYGFMSNKIESNLLQSPTIQSKLVDLTTHAIIRYQHEFLEGLT